MHLNSFIGLRFEILKSLLCLNLKKYINRGMDIDIWLIVLATLGSFLAGFIDAVIGGGGLIQVPILLILFPQFPHTSIIATNRMSSIAGTLVAARQYIKKIKINYGFIAIAGVLSGIASYMGTFVMKAIPNETFKTILFVIIGLLTLYTVLRKSMGLVDVSEKNKHKHVIFAFIGIVLGLYNGVIGPGTGTLLVFALVQFIGFNFLMSSAYAKLINAISDGSSLIAFLMQGAVVFTVAIPMLIANMCGAYLGSRMAIQNGNKFIRVFFIIVMVLLLGKLAFDIWFS